MSRMIGAVVALLAAGVCRADVAVSVYFGAGFAADTDLTLQEPGGTDLTFKAVGWDDRSLQAPIYYGVRINYWPESTSSNGIALDFTHAKMYADVDQRVTVSGRRSGGAVAATEPLSDTFSNLAMSHGYNLLTLNALHRWRAVDGEVSGVRPYVGMGVGFALPHAEVSTASAEVDEFQRAGWVYQGLLGVNYQSSSDLGFFAEYKWSRGDLEVDLGDGGELAVKPVTHHFAVGASFDVR